MNPVERFSSLVKEAVKKQRADEIAHLERWRASGDPEHLEPLLKAYEPVIQSKIRQYKAPSVNESAFRAELQTHLIKAFETYDPSRGTQLNTHVQNHLLKATRYNNLNQNFAYMPEGQTSIIGKIQRAQNQLNEDLGREPTHAEIAAHIGRPTSVVSRTLKSNRKDIPASKFEDDPDEFAAHRSAEVLSLLPHSLNEEENQVFSHLMGHEGHEQITSTNALAQKLGKTAPQISRIRSSILTKYKGYI